MPREQPRASPPLSRWHGAHALLRASQALCNWALTDGLVREVKATCGSQEAEQLWRATAQVDAGIVRAFVPGQTGERAVRLGHKSLDRALRGCALSLVEALRVPQVNTVLLTLISAEARGVLADLGTALGDVDCSSDSATLMNGRMAPGLSEGELS